MRTLTLLTALSLAAAPLAAQQGNPSDPDNAVQGGGSLPAGWMARTDRSAPVTNVKFTVMEPGWHLTLGPAVVLYRDADAVTGNFHAQAKIHQMKNPRHPEGYGLVVGGADLQGEGQRYTYFLVRGDGTYLIKRRAGAETSNVTDGWTPSPAVAKADSAGKAVNVLEAARVGDTLVFKANGQEVHSMPAGDTDGIVGLRANHNLDLHVEQFVVHDDWQGN